MTYFLLWNRRYFQEFVLKEHWLPLYCQKLNYNWNFGNNVKVVLMAELAFLGELVNSNTMFCIIFLVFFQKHYRALFNFQFGVKKKVWFCLYFSFVSEELSLHWMKTFSSESNSYFCYRSLTSVLTSLKDKHTLQASLVNDHEKITPECKTLDCHSNIAGCVHIPTYSQS